MRLADFVWFLMPEEDKTTLTRWAGLGEDKVRRVQGWAGPVWGEAEASCDVTGHAPSVLRDSYNPEL